MAQVQFVVNSKSPKPPAKRYSIKATFMRQPYLTFMMLVMEDRAVTATMDALSAIRKKYGDDPEIEKQVSMIYCKKRNPVKSGEIGRYLHARDKMLTIDEQCMLADVVGEYDSIVKISENIFKKRVREIVSMNAPECSDENLQIIDKVLYAMISCNLIKDYHLEASEKLPNCDIYMRDVKMHGRYFEMSLKPFEMIAYLILRKPIDFVCHESYISAKDRFVNTVNNNKRLKKYYAQLGIESRTKTDIKPTISDIIKNNNLLTNKTN